jgi:hypothetical protein
MIPLETGYTPTNPTSQVHTRVKTAAPLSRRTSLRHPTSIKRRISRSSTWPDRYDIFPQISWTLVSHTNNTQCNEYGKLVRPFTSLPLTVNLFFAALQGLMGTTVIYCTGDWGAGARQDLCLAPNGTLVPGGKIFSPAFPASCPYVTAVGATQGTGTPEAFLSFADNIYLVPAGRTVFYSVMLFEYSGTDYIHTDLRPRSGYLRRDCQWW